MRHNRLDLNLLVALDALLTECSVTRAAGKVFLTQSAMSGALARLREHFQDDLITPVGKRMVRTEMGEAVWPEVSAILARISQVTQPAAAFDAATASRTFRVAASDYFFSVASSALLGHLERHAPAVGIELLPLGPRLHEELERGAIDLLVIPDDYSNPKASASTLFEDEWVCIAARGHGRLDGRKMTRAQFEALEHVTKRINHPQVPSLEEREIARLKVGRKVVARVPLYSLLPLAVCGTQRVATVPRRLGQMWAQWLPLDVYPLPFKAMALKEVMQWHPVREADRGHQWLRSAMQAVCARL